MSTQQRICLSFLSLFLSLLCSFLFLYLFPFISLFLFSSGGFEKLMREREREKYQHPRTHTQRSSSAASLFLFLSFFLLPRPIEANYSRDHFSAVRGVTRGCINRDQYHYIYYIRYLYPSTTSKGAITKRKGNWRETRWGGKRSGFLIGQAPCR